MSLNLNHTIIIGSIEQSGLPTWPEIGSLLTKEDKNGQTQLQSDPQAGDVKMEKHHAIILKESHSRKMGTFAP